MRDVSRAAAPWTVPFLNLDEQHAELKPDVLAAVSDLIDSGSFTNGPQVSEFEAEWARYCGAAYAVGVASGLDALRLGLVAAGIEPGDEVIVPAMTFVATLEAVIQAGGVPILVDISEADYGLDATAADAAIGLRTRFLLPVHLYGQMADMTALTTLADECGLGIIEDACQAHGARRAGFTAGRAGSIAAAFSFYPAKNLGAMGDAGALVTDDPELAQVVRALREHGQIEKYEHLLEGYTARLDTIQALVLLLKLPMLDRWNEQRRAAAQFYLDNLQDTDLTLPRVPATSEPVWHLFVVRTPARELLADFLRARGIATGRHYPAPVHLAPAYGHLGRGPGAFPVAEELARESLSLPLFPGITEEELVVVVEAVRDFCAGG